MMKKISKRWISLFLVLCMIMPFFGTVTYAVETESDSAVWESKRIDSLTTEELGEGVIYSGTPGGRADEKGAYTFTIFRDGYCEEEATVELHTVDVSAKIGVDYQLIGLDTVYSETEGTVMERNANYDAEESVAQFSKDLEEIRGIAAEREENGTQSALIEEKSDLAKIKEKETGIETRPVYKDGGSISSSIIEPVVNMVTPAQQATSEELNEYVMDNLDEYMETSSISLVTFEPGETYKEITFEVIEDEESEGDEIAYLFLSGAAGALVGDLNSVTITIEDDEEIEDAYIGFSNSDYYIDNGEGNIVLTRTGAKYTAASVEVKINDNVQRVMFKPFDTEKKVKLEASGSGSEKVTLQNFKACKEGEITETKVNFGQEMPAGNASLFASDMELLATNTDSAMHGSKVEFTLSGIKSAAGNGMDIRVDYVPGQYDKDGHLYGKIYDTGYNPEVYVGNYYFGCNFDVGKYTGDSASDRKSYYGYNSSNYSTEPGGYAHLYWYDWRTWREGTSYARISGLDHSLYEKYGIDWSQKKTKYGGQRSRINMYNSDDEKTATTSNAGSFSRTTTFLTSLSKGNMPQAAGGYLEVHAQDSEPNMTPQTSVYAYGVAAMFRRFNITVNQPQKMDFYEPGSGYVSRVPCNIAIGEGHQMRYTEQSLAVKQNTAFDSGIIPGELIGYKIITNSKSTDASKKKTFYYMAAGKKPQDAYGSHSGTYYNASSGTNMESIYFGEDFIKNKIDKNLVQISGSGTSWTTDLEFTPIYRYKNAYVHIVPSENGSLEGLEGDKTYENYHIGDTLDFVGKPNDDTWIFDGVWVTMRSTYNMNETPKERRFISSANSAKISLMLGEKNCSFYQIEPVFKKKRGNYISFNNEAASNITIRNLLSDGELKTLIDAYPSYGFETGQNILIAKPDAKGSTEAERILNSITVQEGEIYQIYAEGKVTKSDKNNTRYYKPVFYNKYYSGHKITSRVFDYIASSDLSKNKITVSADLRNTSDEQYMSLLGNIESEEYSVRQTAATKDVVGISDLSVAAGDRGLVDMWIKKDGKDMKIQAVERATDVTGGDGEFELNGIFGKQSDAVTLYYNNGDTSGVRVINISELKNIGAKGDIEFITNKASQTGNTNEQEKVEAKGTIYDLKKSDVNAYKNIYTPVFTSGSPYPTNIDYAYFSGANTEMFGTYGNSVAVVDDKLTLTIRLNRQGRQISKIVLTVDKAIGNDKDYEIQGKVDTDVYTYDFNGAKLKDIFLPGDRLYITLYDAQQREIKYPAVDENNNETYTSTFENIKYNKIFTGLSFYVPTLINIPQEFKLPDTVETTVPVLGNLKTSGTSGLLTFSMIDWDEDENGETGFSIVIDANINAWNKNAGTATGQDVLKNVKKQKNAAMDKVQGFVDEGLMSDKEETKKFFRDLWWERSMVDTFSKPIMKLSVVVLMNYDFAYDDVSGQYINTGGQVVFGGAFDIKYTFYWICGGVPLFVQLSGNVALQLQANYGGTAGLGYDKFKTYGNVYDAVNSGNDDVGLFLELRGKVTAGVGICGVLSARGIIQADVKTFTSFMHIEDNSGILASIEGGIGFDLLVISMEFTVGYAGGAGIFKDQTGWTGSLFTNEEQVKLDEVRVYDSGSDGKIDNVKKDNGFDILLEDAADRTKPQVVKLNDGRKLLVYLGADNSRDVKINKQCLYYSIYENGEWQEAQIIDNDGTADGTPAVEQYGNKVIVAWADAQRKFTQDEVDKGKYKEILSEFDISASVFDGTSFDEELRVSDDEKNYADNEEYKNAKFLDYAPVICSDNDDHKGVGIFYMKRAILDAENDAEMVSSTAVYETVAMAAINNEGVIFKEQFVGIEGDPLILDFDAKVKKYKYKDGEENHLFAVCTYVADRDGQNIINDNSDWDVYLLIHDVTANKTYEPVNLCNDFLPDTNAQVTEVGDELILTFVKNHPEGSDSSGTSIFNYMHVTSFIEELMHGAEREDGTYEWNINMETILSDSDESDNIYWYQKTASELGLSDEQYKDSVFDRLYNKEFPVNSTTMKINESVNASLGNYKLQQGKDNKLYLLWIDTGSAEEDDYSIELYGAVKSLEGEDEEETSWSKPVKLTDFAKETKNTVIDEFSVDVDEDGQFTLVSNMYVQNLVNGKPEYSENSLIAFTLDESGELIFDKTDSIFGNQYPKAKEETTVKYVLKNDGLQKLDLLKAAISVTGGETVETELNGTILGGDSKELEASIVMPETVDKDTTVTITVETKDGQSISLTEKIPYGPILKYTTKEIIEDKDGKLSYIAEITNNGNKNSGKFTLDVQRVVDGEGLVGKVSSVKVGSIEAGETVKCIIELDEETLIMSDFEENGFVSLSLTSEQLGENTASDIKRVGVKKVRKVEAEDDTDDEKEDKPVSKPDNNTNSGMTASPNRHNSSGLPFSDVKADEWYYDSVKYCYSNGLFKGTTDTTFEPESPITRGMFVTVLHRAEDTPPPKNQAGFSDVDKDSYYNDAVSWAYENSIINGYGDGNFGPEDEITREQMAAMIYRYSQYKQKELTSENKADIKAFEDYGDISEYAYDAIQYMCDFGFLKGMPDNTLRPNGLLTRAEMATVMMRYFNEK